MIRRLLCLQCAGKDELAPQDVASGWLERKVGLKAHRPEGLAITTTAVNGVGLDLGVVPVDPAVPVVTQVRVMMCDFCSKAIAEGDSAVAVTLWDSNREGTPGPWEAEYSVGGVI